MKPAPRAPLIPDGHSTVDDTPEYLKQFPEKPSARPTDVVLPPCLVKSDALVLSPLIFTKKVPSIKPDGRMSTQTLMLESLLGLVSKFYYRSSFDVADLLKDLGSCADGALNGAGGKEAHRRGPNSVRRSKRVKKGERRDRKIPPKEQGKERPAAGAPDDANLLDYLISPVKTDYCVGGLTRKLDAEGTGRVRGRHLRLWQTLRYDSHDGRQQGPGGGAAVVQRLEDHHAVPNLAVPQETNDEDGFECVALTYEFN